MWILDSKYRDGMELWVKDKETRKVKEAFRQSFLMHLPDEHAHQDMIDSLKSRYDAESCSFRSIYGPLEGYRIFAVREVAEAI